jgi:FtsP/CotA-like multicopper oxidase with cupredoxin domain
MVFATPAAMVSVGLLLLGHGIYAKSDGLTFASRRSPPYTFSFQFPLTIPQIKKPLTTYTNPETGVPINFYQVEIKNSEHIFYPNLKNGSVWGYDGTFPGPTFQIQRGHESVVRVINKLTKAVNFHVHGSYSTLLLHGREQLIVTVSCFVRNSLTFSKRGLVSSKYYY